VIIKLSSIHWQQVLHIIFTTKAPVTSADTTGPVISSIVAITGTSSAQIGWMTNEYASSRVYYSASSSLDVNATNTLLVDKSSLDKNHLVTITGLSLSTTYYFIVESTDASGNVTRSTIFSAKTTAAPLVIDTTAPSISNSIAIVASSNVQLNWTTNEPASSRVYYSSSTPVGTSSAYVENTSLVTAHSISATGLKTSTPYHMVIESKDVAGNTAQTNDFVVTTTLGL
jgi:hypothetical protein